MHQGHRFDLDELVEVDYAHRVYPRHAWAADVDSGSEFEPDELGAIGFLAQDIPADHFLVKVVLQELLEL